MKKPRKKEKKLEKKQRKMKQFEKKKKISKININSAVKKKITRIIYKTK